MGCFCEGNEKHKDLEAMRELAKKIARLERCVLMICKCRGGILRIMKENEECNGILMEYIYP